MKTSHILGIGILFVLALATAFMTVAFHQPASAAQDVSMLIMQAQVTITPTPLPQDISEIGSTDGILLMVFVIAFISVLPMIFRKKK